MSAAVEVWASLALCVSAIALAVSWAALREARRAHVVRESAERGQRLAMSAGPAKVDRMVHGTTEVRRRGQV